LNSEVSYSGEDFMESKRHTTKRRRRSNQKYLAKASYGTTVLFYVNVRVVYIISSHYYFFDINLHFFPAPSVRKHLSVGKSINRC